MLKIRRIISIILTTFIFVLILGLQGYASNDSITFLTPETDPSSIEVDNYIAKSFEEETGIKVNIQHANLEDVLPKLSAQLRAGTAPDVAFFSPRMVPGLVEQGFLVSLEDVFEELGDIPINRVTPIPGNKIYDIPIHVESQVLYYRTDLFEKAGVQPPTTFDEWLKVAEDMTVDTNGDGQVDQYGVALLGGMPSNYFYFSAILWANGGDYFDENNNVVIDSPEAIEALEFWAKLSKYAPPGFINSGNYEVGNQFASGLTAMCRFPGRTLINIDRENPDLLSKLWVVPTPVGPSGDSPVVHAVSNCFIVFNGENSEMGKEFVKHYMSGERYYKYLTSATPGHALPIRTSWADNPEYFESPFIKQNADIIKESIKLQSQYGTDFQYRNGGVVNPYLGQALSMPTLSVQINKCLNGDVTAEDALKTVADDWRQTFGIK